MQTIYFLFVCPVYNSLISDDFDSNKTKNKLLKLFRWYAVSHNIDQKYIKRAVYNSLILKHEFRNNRKYIKSCSSFKYDHSYANNEAWTSILLPQTFYNIAFSGKQPHCYR